MKDFMFTIFHEDLFDISYTISVAGCSKPD